MAASVATTQPFLANLIPRGSMKRVPRQRQLGALHVRCQKEGPSSDQSSPSNPETKSSPSIPPTQPLQTPTPKTTVPKMSTKFSDVLAFSGPAPELINGRLAMVGFVAAIGAEIAKGEDVLAQLANGGLPWFLGTTVVLSLASLIPLFKGVTPQSKSDGLMTSDAELWNGRFAMLGLVALVITEYIKGGALV